MGRPSRYSPEVLGGTSPTPVIVSTVIGQGSFAIGSFDRAAQSRDICVLAGLVPLTTQAFGDLEVTVDWAGAANNLNIALVDGECTCRDLRDAGSAEELNQVRPLVAQSAGETTKPEQITARNREPGRYTLVVLNFGSAEDRFSYQAISRMAC